MKQLFLLLAFVAIAQVTWGQETGMVNGKIVQKGTATPLAGASILIKSKKVGTVTDSLGQFELEAAIGDTIQVIYGEASKTFEVYTFLPLMVALTLDTDRQHNALSFQAGSLPLAHLGATEQVTTDHFNPIHLTDPAQLFTGQFAGLNLQRPDGDPTSAFDLRIRGFTSLTQQYEPLILVDGVPEANYRLIDPQEIESIQIVKDLATAASYGVRAANGIIDIRLKEVSQQKPRLEYRAYSAFSSPTATVDVLDAAQYRTAIGNNFFDGVDGGQATDWQEEILRSTAFSNSHQLSFSGQVDELRYRASLHYRDIQGVIQQSGYEQVGARLFLDYTTLKGRLQLRHSTTINNRATEDFNYNQALGGELGSRNAPITYAIQANPTFPVWENDDPASGQYSAPFNPFFAENPLSRLNQTVNEQEQTFALSTTTAIVKVMEGLEVEATYGLV
ncbi:MAG: TonB-dependent receptor plug domain-containing protein, partial [Bacteroidota bacterium]